MQLGFTDLEYEHRKKKTRQPRLLEEREAGGLGPTFWLSLNPTIPSGAMDARPFPGRSCCGFTSCSRGSGGGDPAAEAFLIDVEPARRLVGVDARRGPDETTIGQFRHRWQKHNFTPQLFALRLGLGRG